MSAWGRLSEEKKNAVRRDLARRVGRGELTRELIEEALAQAIPGFTVEDDGHHEMVTSVAAEYIRNGGMDA